VNTIRRTPAARFLLLGFTMMLAVGAAGCSRGTSAPARSAGASPAQEVKLEFTLPTPAGDPVDLRKFDGSIRVVDFWATWCPPCREEIPHLNELHRKYKGQGVNIVGISVDENPKVLAAFDRDVHIEYASLMTSKQAEEAFGGVAGLPSTFVLDRQGRIYKSYVGEIEPGTLESDIQALLAVR
jgi:thiol-disulfide isomerase/thioredoxin